MTELEQQLARARQELDYLHGLLWRADNVISGQMHRLRTLQRDLPYVLILVGTLGFALGVVFCRWWDGPG